MTMKQQRNLTAGEVEMDRTIFANAIDYEAVRMIRGRWWPFQPKCVVMAPTGNIHFHPRGPLWSDDFSKEELHDQGLFMHEMTHVWQTQTCGRFYLPLMRHPFCRYRYDLVPGRPFHRYGLEQQAEIVRHQFLAEMGMTVAQLPDLQLLPFGRTVTETQQS